MKTKSGVAIVTDDYLDLIRQFPLRAIRTDRDNTAAAKVLTRLLGRSSPALSDGESQYLDALIELVSAYESRAYPTRSKRPSPIEIVRFLMEENKMTVADLGKILGNKTAASLVLSGKRELSKAHIRKLAARFKVDPGLFL
jgi:HTH-type transcriptional regulator / antitoxin HigA